MPTERKKDDTKKDLLAQYIRQIHMILSMVIDPIVKRNLLGSLLREAQALGIDISILDEIKHDIENLPTASISIALGREELVTRADQQALYEMGNVLEAICTLFPNSVSERTKQDYITQGMEFNSKIVDKNGKKIAEINTLNSLTDSVKPAITKKAIDDLNKFLKDETGKSALTSAHTFDAACKKMSHEARTTQDQNGKTKTKTWTELVDSEKSALTALEASRHEAGKLLTAEKRMGVMAEIQKIGKAIKVDTTEPTESIAFEMLKNVRLIKEQNLGKTSAVAKLEASTKSQTTISK